MQEIKRDYYANQFDIQLREFFEYELPKLGQTYYLTEGLYLLNIVKYMVRAGKKDGNSYEQDVQKVDDYCRLLAKFMIEHDIMNFSCEAEAHNYCYDSAKKLVERFNEYLGKEKTDGSTDNL